MNKVHNDAKRTLIEQCVRPGDTVLDCGCGRGGDWHKWKAVRARVTGVDPDAMALLEASSRAMSIGLDALVHWGDVRNVHNGPFRVVCFNFSLHYTAGFLHETAAAIARNVEPGGLLIGIVPEASRISEFVGEQGHRTDALGNVVEVISPETLSVHVTNGPFYADGPKYEPILDRQNLLNELDPYFELVEWKPMLAHVTGHISDIYASFIFRRKV
jgi:SAM-dependent methyltransferase